MNIQLPRLVTAHDYHYFKDLTRSLTQIAGRGIKIQEVGFDSSTSRYVGVVYAGRKPSKLVIGQLAHVQKISWGQDDD